MLIWLVQNFKVRVDKPFVGNVERNMTFGCGVNSHCIAHFGIHILEPAHALSRVQVESNFKVSVPDFLQKCFVIWYEVCVPAVTRPTVCAAVIVVVFAAFSDVLALI